MKQLKRQQESRKLKMIKRKKKDREKLDLQKKNKRESDLKELNMNVLSNSVLRKRLRMKTPRDVQLFKASKMKLLRFFMSVRHSTINRKREKNNGKEIITN